MSRSKYLDVSQSDQDSLSEDDAPAVQKEKVDFFGKDHEESLSEVPQAGQAKATQNKAAFSLDEPPVGNASGSSDDKSSTETGTAAMPASSPSNNKLTRSVTKKSSTKTITAAMPAAVSRSTSNVAASSTTSSTTATTTRSGLPGEGQTVRFIGGESRYGCTEGTVHGMNNSFKVNVPVQVVYKDQNGVEVAKVIPIRKENLQW